MLRRSTWRQLYLKNMRVSALIYVVSISEEIERLKESRETLLKLINEPLIAGSECNILALVYNNKPNLAAKDDEEKDALEKETKGGHKSDKKDSKSLN